MICFVLVMRELHSLCLPYLKSVLQRDMLNWPQSQLCICTYIDKPFETWDWFQFINFQKWLEKIMCRGFKGRIPKASLRIKSLSDMFHDLVKFFEVMCIPWVVSLSSGERNLHDQDLHTGKTQILWIKTSDWWYQLLHYPIPTIIIWPVTKSNRK